MPAILTFLPVLMLLVSPVPVPSPATPAPPPNAYFKASPPSLDLPALTPLRLDYSDAIDRSA